MRTDQYNDFAQFYDKFMGDREVDIQKILSLIQKFVPNARSVLETACGTGSILLGLKNKGFDVWGIDSSEMMISVAKEKVPSAKLFVQDMRNISLDITFDVIICVFDSINHLLKFKDWEKAFVSWKKHLNPGGIIIFDMNTIKKLDKLCGPNNKITKKKGDFVATLFVSKELGDIYVWHIKISKDNEPGIVDMYTKETSFKVSDIVQSLKKYFSDVMASDWDGNTLLESADRVVFVCHN